MSAFTPNSPVGTPTWTATPYPANAFIPQSDTGFAVVQGGYGEGGYGEDGYGDNSQTIAVLTNLNTTWTAYTTK